MRAFGIVLSVTLAVFAFVGPCPADSNLQFPGKGSKQAWERSTSPYNQACDLAKAGQHTQAIKLYRRAIEIYPYDSSPYFNMANSAKKIGDNETAETAYKSALSLEPTKLLAWVNLGNLYSDTSKYDLAKNAYKRALSFDPDSFLALVNYADLLEKQAKYDEAYHLYLRARKTVPSEHRKELEQWTQACAGKLKTAHDH